MSKQKKYHYIYKTTCKITGKFYVGMHSTDNLEDGYLGSGKILGYSRAKYGDENHVKEILEYLPSRIELKEREKEIVNEELLAQPLNINLKYGGEGGQTSEITKRSWENTSARINHSNGRKNAWKNPVNRIKWLRAGEMGRAASLIARKNEPKRIGAFLGKTHSEQTKQKMRKSKNVGEANSQFGTCWVTNGVKPIKIKKENLDEYLSNGYSRGRK